MIALYSKTGGQNGKHQAISSAENIAGLSHIAVQLFQFDRVHRRFDYITDTSSALRTKHFGLLQSREILTVISSTGLQVVADGPATFVSYKVDTAADAFKMFQLLHKEIAGLNLAMQLFRKRGSKNAAPPLAEESDAD